MDLYVYASGGFGREVAWLASACADAGAALRVLGFLDDDASRHGMVVNELPVLGLDAARAATPDALVVVAAGAPAVRERIVARVAEQGFGFATLVHPRVERSRFVQFGRGTIVCAGCILTTDIRLGEHVHVNLDCTIGHDAVLHDFATLAPGVHVSGNVHVGRRAYVGTGAAIINGSADAPLVIGDDAVVGAGAVVTRDVPPGTTVVGVPARPR